MAWNGSTGANAPKKVEPKAPSKWRGLVALVVAGVVGSLVLVVFLLSPTSAKSGSQRSASDNLIKDIAAAADDNNMSAPKNLSKTEDRAKTVVSLTTNVVCNDPMKVPITLTEADFDRYRKRDKTSIFPHRSENVIANLLRREPGAMFYGARNNRGMTADFIKSCTVPIIVSPDDDEWTKELKREMIETKKELKARIDAGEKLEDILDQTQDEYRKLGLIKHMVEKEVREATLFDKKATAADILCVKEAADALLAQKGIAPLKINPIIERRIMRLNQTEEKK